MTKKMVKDSHHCFISDQCTLADIKTEVERLITTYGENSTVDFDSGYNSIDETITFEREETDKEYQKRLKDEARERDNRETLQLAKEAKERKEYERLAKKYGDKR